MPETSPSSTVSVIQQIPVDQIHPSRHQARKDFNEEDDKQLADSIGKEGLIQPITVRKVEGGYEAIAGERRLRAVKSLGWPTIEARVIEVVSEAAACAKGLVENLQRKDLNPIEEAEGFQNLNQLDSGHWTQEEIGKVAGKGHNYISQSLGLLKLPQSVQDNSRRRELTRSAALELLRLTDPKQQEEVAKQAVDHNLSVKETRKLVDQMLGGGGKKAAKNEEPAAKSSNQGFRFTKKGTSLAITAPFPETSDLDKFLADLRAAFLEWSSKAAVAEAPAVTATSAASVDGRRFPKTPAEEASFRQLPLQHLVQVRSMPGFSVKTMA